jgi:hypothetical protein
MGGDRGDYFSHHEAVGDGRAFGRAVKRMADSDADDDVVVQ